MSFYSFYSIVDIVIVVSVLSTFNLTSVQYIHIHNLYEAVKYVLFGAKRFRILRGLRVDFFLQAIKDPVKRQISVMTLVIVLMILFFAAIMQYLEEQANGFSFHTWMYFAWITLTTVGYGDITARTTLGRIAVMIMIAIAMVVIPKLTNDLIEIVNSQSVYARAFYSTKTKYSEHVVICGNLSTMHFQDFFSQLFHEDHDNYDLTAVVVSPDPPSAEVVLLLKKYSILYLQGSPFCDDDLKRAKVETARAIFLITNKFSYNMDEEDARIILLNMSLKKYLANYRLSNNPYPEEEDNRLNNSLFCLQLNRRENRRHLYDDDFHEMIDNDLVICFNEIKLGVIAKSAVVPGIASFLLNLITSFSEEDLAAHGRDSEEENNQIASPSVWKQ
jgi:voltage-gated potassium channel Kch